MQTVRRELAEEIGKAAARWEPITDYVSSVGIMDETVHLFHATGLSDARAEAEHNERIEIVRWPLAELDAWLAPYRRFWAERLDALQAHLDQEQP